MVNQFGIKRYLLTWSFADLTLDNLPNIINKLNTFSLSDEKINNLVHQQQTKLFNDNPVFVARHFQYKFQVSFKEIVLERPLGKAKFYALCIEF